MINSLSATELYAKKNTDPSIKILDVREQNEYAICHIDGSLHIPMNDIPSRIDELDKQEQIVVLCHHGMRSMQVAMFLEKNGFDKISNLEGGIHAWSIEVDSSMPQY